MWPRNWAWTSIFGQGDTPYKLRWADDVDVRTTFVLANNLRGAWRPLKMKRTERSRQLGIKGGLCSNKMGSALARETRLNIAIPRRIIRLSVRRNQPVDIGVLAAVGSAWARDSEPFLTVLVDALQHLAAAFFGAANGLYMKNTVPCSVRTARVRRRCGFPQRRPRVRAVFTWRGRLGLDRIPRRCSVQFADARTSKLRDLTPQPMETTVRWHKLQRCASIRRSPRSMPHWRILPAWRRVAP